MVLFKIKIGLVWFGALNRDICIIQFCALESHQTSDFILLQLSSLSKISCDLGSNVHTKCWIKVVDSNQLGRYYKINLLIFSNLSLCVHQLMLTDSDCFFTFLYPCSPARSANKQWYNIRIL